MKINWKNILSLVLVVAVVIIGVSLLSGDQKEKDEFVYSELVEMFNEDIVYSFIVDPSQQITVKTYVYSTDANGK